MALSLIRARGIRRSTPPCAGSQFRALQQFFKWLTDEEELPDAEAGMKPPHVQDKPAIIFADGDLLRLERACAGRSFQQRRDATVIAMLRTTEMRPSELASIRYDPRRRDIDLWTCHSLAVP